VIYDGCVQDQEDVPYSAPIWARTEQLAH
jgi:hypothetical protein